MNGSCFKVGRIKVILSGNSDQREQGVTPGVGQRRAHHRELHRAGKELDWWSRIGIEPLQPARTLWCLTHPQ